MSGDDWQQVHRQPPGAGGVGNRSGEGVQEQLLIKVIEITVSGDGQQLTGHVEQGAIVAGGVVAQGSAEFSGHELRRAGLGEGVAEAGEQFLGTGARQGEADPDTAVQRQQFLCLQALAEAAVTGQDDGEQEVGVELCLAQQAQFIQHRRSELLGLVDQQDRPQQSGVDMGLPAGAQQLGAGPAVVGPQLDAEQVAHLAVEVVQAGPVVGTGRRP